MVEALDIQVKGIVQGVGFRPFVYRLAKKYLINGWVLNAADGVFIHAEGEGKLLDEFVLEISDNAPAASRVEEIDLKEVPLDGFESFEIRFSDAAAVEKTTLVSPDLATCDDCAHELFNPNDRRYRYPFINCTNCGPRFTIIEQLPYDRKSTSMKEFPLCERCGAEYHDPANRRFHAQPNACFECGPHVSLAYLSPTAAPCGEASAPCGETATSCDQPTTPCDQATAPTHAGTGAPRVEWGTTREESDAIFAQAVDLLLAGKILAVKGLGGFHLVCDATNTGALATLRTRKHREGKAFAVMMRDAQAVRNVCEVSEVEEDVLTSVQRPIVLLRKRADAAFAAGLADALPELGVMLSYTPVQHLLLHDFIEAGGSGMLVMTSGNLHDEPIVTDDEEAYVKLANIADAVLGNNRAIRARYDDSVVRVIKAGSAGEAVQFIRRARGYAPLPLTVPSACQPTEQADAAESRSTQSCPASEVSRTEVRHASACEPISGTAESLADSETPANTPTETFAEAPTPTNTSTNTPAKAPENVSRETFVRVANALFATGSEQKNTFALVRSGEGAAEAFVSQHIGDMENAETYDAWLEAKKRFETLFEITPTHLACDMHPEYLTSKWAHEQASKCNLPITEVQHHHAHIASVMGEHGMPGPVCGIAFDGTGYGVEGAIWGGEALLCNQTAFERFANFAYIPMPGGAAAVKNPLRMAYGALWAFDLLEHPGAAETLEALGSQAAICNQMIEQGINTPATSSVGRLFDAASALLGICTNPTYEGEPAILLEAALGETQTNVSRETCSNPPVARSVSGGISEGTSTGENYSETPYEITITKNTATSTSTAQDTSVLLFDAASAFEALLNDKVAGVPVPVIARRFHDAFVQAIVNAAELVRSLYGINDVVLSGGVFMNRYLIEHALSALETAGFTVAVNRDLPPNDGCISFGQAVVAWAANKESAAASNA